MSDRDGLQRAAFRTTVKVLYKWDKFLHHHISTISQAEMQVVILTDTFCEEQNSNKWMSDNSKPEKNPSGILCNINLAHVE